MVSMSRCDGVKLSLCPSPTMFVIGKREMEAGAVSVRVHGKGNLGAKPRKEVIADLLAAIKERTA